MDTAIFFHIDVNSAFLSWTALEQLEAGSETDLRLIPSIIGGDLSKRHGVVLAKSVPAKAYGIVTGEPVVNAFRKCPHLTTAAPNHSLYHRKSSQLMEYLSGICPDIEQVSIDECYMDYSPISSNYTSPEAAAAIIKDTVYEKFGFTVNVGISDRKILAKMASDFKKPNLVHTLYSWEIQEKMWKLPVSSLFLCGKSSADTLHKLGILTIGDLALSDPVIIESHLKSHGHTLWQYANGIDSSTIFSEPAKMRGIGNSTTLSSDVQNAADAKKILLSLSEQVSSRLRKSHQLARTVTIEIKYNNFQSYSKQTQLFSPDATSGILYEYACRLFDELWDGTPIRLLGLRTSKLLPEDAPVQLSLFDFGLSTATNLPEKDTKNRQSSATQTCNAEKQKRLEIAIDQIRKRYGADAVTRGTLLKKIT